MREGKFEIDLKTSSVEDVFNNLKTSDKGLTEKEARTRLRTYGYNDPAKKKKVPFATQFILKLANPLVIVLLIIGGFSFFFGDKLSALIVTIMAFLSVLLSVIQEYRAGREAEKLGEMVRATATVIRNGKEREIKIRDIVPGDIIDLYAGDIIPADLKIFFAKDLFINESSLTGESFPAEKISGGATYMGSSVVSGTGLGIAFNTGRKTQFSELSKHVSDMYVETSFDKGIKGFTWLMVRAMLFMVLLIFLINAIKRGSLLESFLFSLGVAVGLTPEMLPMLVTVNLSRGALEMAKKKAIVKRLNSIQNFGAMDIICTDKTGTLTLDQIVLEVHCDVEGKPDEDVLKYGFINSSYQTGLKNLLDRAILKHEKFNVAQVKKLDEIPFDFERKIMSVIVEMDEKRVIISKGAPEEIFKRCAKYELHGSLFDMHHGIHMNLKAEFDKLSREGFRVLAIAYKNTGKEKETYSKDDETELILKGYLAFLDPPKASTKGAILALEKLGIEVKVLTGDNEYVSEHICREVGLNVTGLMKGEEIDRIGDEQLKGVAEATTVFTRLSPLQKERIIKALQGSDHVVGYLGDGVNDSVALKAADVGISVNNAADIAKESADIILLKKSLMVLRDGVVEGRKTFGNIIKYIKMGSSSNFGNMLSMTGASFFLPFLPMLPLQILLNNFLYDMSQIALPFDDVDEDYVARPRKWKIDSIKNFMVTIGPISSIFDFLTFGLMFFVFRAGPALFRTGWFVESLCTQTLVIYIIRTCKIPFIESRPSKWLVLNTLLIVVAGILIPLSPLSRAFHFVVPPPLYFLALAAMIAAYLMLVQAVKSFLVKRFGFD